MNISLTPQLEELVKRKVASGMYNNASEVIREALRLLDEHERARAEVLRAAIAVGYAQVERGEVRQLTPELLAEIDRNVARKAEAGQRPKADVLP
jgi:antitoxin ParD1/3/4